MRKVTLRWSDGHSDGFVDLRSGFYSTVEATRDGLEVIYQKTSRTGLSGTVVAVEKPYHKITRLSYNIRRGVVEFKKEGGKPVTIDDIRKHEIVLPNIRFHHDGRWELIEQNEPPIHIWRDGNLVTFCTEGGAEVEEISFYFYTRPSKLERIGYRTNLKIGSRAISTFFEPECLRLMGSSPKKVFENIPLYEWDDGYYWCTTQGVPVRYLGSTLPFEFGNYVFPTDKVYYCLVGNSIELNVLLPSVAETLLVDQEAFFRKPLRFWIAFAGANYELSSFREVIEECGDMFLPLEYALQRNCRDGVENFAEKYGFNDDGILLKDLVDNPHLPEMWVSERFVRTVLEFIKDSV